MVNVDETLAEAREAHKRHEYAAAYRRLAEARAVDSLPADDLQLYADAAWWLGLVSEHLAVTEELHTRYLAEGQVDRAALQALDLCGTYFMRGEPMIASGWLSRARKLLAGDRRSEGHAMLLYVDVSGAIEEGELEVASAGAGELQELGRDLGEPTYGALGVLCEGLITIRRGQLSEGFALLDEAMLPVLAGMVKPEWAGHIYCTIIAVCEDLADLVRARQWTAATERWLESFSDAVMFHGVCRAHRVHLLATEGSWDKAVAEGRRVLDELAEMNQDALARAEYELGDVHRLCGDHEAARTSYEACAVRGRAPQPGLALLEAELGRITLAWELITAAVAASPEPLACAPLLRAQVEIGLLAGHLDAATSAYQRLRRTSETHVSPGFLAWADQAEGAVLLASGDAAAAVPPLEAAAARFHRMHAPYDAGVTERLLARALAALGRAGEAQTHADAAAALFGAIGLAGQRPVIAPAGLTERETEVLLLVTRGASNREAGAALCISEATVRRHLANIFRKLEVTSRTAAAAWAHDHGLVAR